MLWNDPIFLRTAFVVLGAIFFSGAFVFFFRRQSYYFASAWASINSWLIGAPILFVAFALPRPGPLVALCVFAIYGAKAFFKILGMYHRHYFVLICYLGICALGLAIHFQREDLYNKMPMLLLAAACLVPVFLRSFKRMIQYISLTLLGFIFLGWSFLHLGLLLELPNGIYQIVYLVILTEFCDNTNLATSYYLKGPRLFPAIDRRRTVLSTAVSMGLTMLLAVVMRWILPSDSERYWLVAGLVACFGGLLGDLLMTAIRRDAGVKDVGPFILGRGDFLQRMDRLIFVAPIYYYLILSFSPNG
jgi:phosphatidate cytidylyltransferase